MHNYLTISLIYLSLFFSGNLTAQQLFSKQALKTDLSILKQSLLKYHPNLFAYQDEAEFHQSFEEAEKKIVKNMTESEFYILVKPLVSNIKCSHTELYHSNRYLAKRKDYSFPIQLKVSNNSIHVVSSTIAQIPKGSEILSMDGLESNQVIQTLKRYISSDGLHDNGRIHWLNKNFFEIYTDILGQDLSVQLVVKNKETLKEVTLNPKFTVKSQTFREPLLSSSIEMIGNEKRAILTIKSFDNALLKANGIQFNKYLKTFFGQLTASKINHLTIDLRDNTGGNDLLAIKLYSYISKQSFKFYESLQLYKRSKKHLPLPQKAFFWTKKTDNSDVVKFKGHQGLKFIDPVKNSFNGNVEVLIDGGTMSAAAHFAAKCHNTQRARIQGSTSAGTYQHSNSGFLIYNLLPHTRLQLFTPAIHYKLYLPNKELITEAIEPDPNADPLDITQ